MKPCFPSFLLVLLTALALVAPAFATTVLYTNGPVNDWIAAWSFSGIYGHEVADSFVLSGAATVGAFEAGLWADDTPTTVDWEILTGGPDWLGETVVSSGSATWFNAYSGFVDRRFTVYTSKVGGLNVSLGAGTYWLELLKGQTSEGHEVFWNESDGPSLAYQNVTGPIPSEAFTIYAAPVLGIPESSTLAMFGSGVIALASILRRKIDL